MKVTTELEREELTEFLAWLEDREMYKKELRKNGRRLLMLAEKVTFAIEIDNDDKHYCVADQDHLDELAEMAYEILEG